MQESWKPGKSLLDEFEIVRNLGKGGMGEVRLAKNLLTGKQFAVKSISFSGGGTDEKARKEFLEELQLWIDLPEHPVAVITRMINPIFDIIRNSPS